MRLSRGWRRLIFFWVGFVSLCGIGAATLQILGPPQATEDSKQENYAGPTIAQPESHVSDASSVPAPASSPNAVAISVQYQEQMLPEQAMIVPPETSAAIDDGALMQKSQMERASLPALQEASPEPKTTVALETTDAPDKRDNVQLTPISHVVFSEPDTTAVSDSIDEANETGSHDVDKAGKKLHLRVARDRRHCSGTTCLTWHVLKQRGRAPRAVRIDMAGLHLAPDLREAAEKGKVELIVDAVEQRETIKGRSMVILVATDVTGVRPHEGRP
jgi:hypothetical protein